MFEIVFENNKWMAKRTKNNDKSHFYCLYFGLWYNASRTGAFEIIIIIRVFARIVFIVWESQKQNLKIINRIMKSMSTWIISLLWFWISGIFRFIFSLGKCHHFAFRPYCVNNNWITGRNNDCWKEEKRNSN